MVIIQLQSKNLKVNFLMKHKIKYSIKEMYNRIIKKILILQTMNKSAMKETH